MRRAERCGSAICCSSVMYRSSTATCAASWPRSTKLKTVRADLAIPGHGRALAWPEAIAPEERYLNGLLADVRAAIKAKRTLAETLATVDGERGAMAVVRPVSQAQRHRGLRRARVGRLSAKAYIVGIAAAATGWRRARRRRTEVDMTRRFVCVILALGFAAAGAARGAGCESRGQCRLEKGARERVRQRRARSCRRRGHAGYAQACRGRGHRPAGDPGAVPADEGALYRNDLAHHRQQSVADRSGVPLYAGKRPRRHRDPDPDRGVHAMSVRSR